MANDNASNDVISSTKAWVRTTLDFIFAQRLLRNLIMKDLEAKPQCHLINHIARSQFFCFLILKVFLILKIATLLTTV